MHFGAKLDKLYAAGEIEPILFAAIHCGADRKNEYGTQFFPDYKDRGARAGLYTSFIFDELLPYIRKKYNSATFREKAFAGFSLGALSALDIVWNRPGEFSKVGCFSASFWWRSLDQLDPGYDDDKHRIMHQQIRNGKFAPWLDFFFQCGNLDEKKDRNKNGIIDSIDDTLDLIKELVDKGYDREKDIHYLELEDGHHDVFTWGRAIPEFLRWGWGRKDAMIQNREF
jgi:enterochelin esterase-like enzyme